jgi:hypothetical protein
MPHLIPNEVVEWREARHVRPAPRRVLRALLSSFWGTLTYPWECVSVAPRLVLQTTCGVGIDGRSGLPCCVQNMDSEAIPWVFVRTRSGASGAEVVFPVPLTPDVNGVAFGTTTGAAASALQHWLATAVPAAHATYCPTHPRLVARTVLAVQSAIGFLPSSQLLPSTVVTVEAQGLTGPAAAATGVCMCCGARGTRSFFLICC